MISVIVPVYRVEEYLDKCVQSILAQTYRDFEILLVDDGSPDACPKLCDIYAQSYDCIRALHKSNGGLSDARNFGVERARGSEVTFIDSDDFVAPDYLEVLVKLKQKYQADIAVTGIYRCFSFNTNLEKKIDAHEFLYTGKEALEKMLYQDTLDTSACAMLLSTSIAKKYRFPVGKYHEDEFTTYKYYLSANRVIVTTQKQYFYLQREGSIMHVFGQSSLDELEAADNLVAFCEENYPELVTAAKSKKFSDYCQVLLSNKDIKNSNTEVYMRIYSFLDSVKFEIALDNKCRVKNRVAALLYIINKNLLFAVKKFTGTRFVA